MEEKAKPTITELIAKIEKARTYTLALTDESKKTSSEKSDITKSKKIAEAIKKVPNICNDGRKSIVDIFNIFINELNLKEKIAKIEYSYLDDINNSEFDFPILSVIVPKNNIDGWKKDQLLLYVGKYSTLWNGTKPYFIRESGQASAVDYISRNSNNSNKFRKATVEEINTFYNTFIKWTELKKTLSPKLKIPEVKKKS